jgi:hypothetical protein
MWNKTNHLALFSPVRLEREDTSPKDIVDCQRMNIWVLLAKKGRFGG